MAIIETWLNQDINEAVKVRYIDGNMFSMDNGGNRINVTVMDGDSPATLSGTVSANVIRSDGSTVAVTGTYSGNTASVVLPQACYVIPGVISIVVKITDSTTVTTIAAVVANVYQSSTDSVVDPGTIIPSIETLIAQIEAAVATIPADYSDLWSTIAPNYANLSFPVYTGNLCTYDGHLYRSKGYIPSSEPWTSSHWEQTDIANNIADVRNIVNRNMFVPGDNILAASDFDTTTDANVTYTESSGKITVTNGSTNTYACIQTSDELLAKLTPGRTYRFHARCSVESGNAIPILTAKSGNNFVNPLYVGMNGYGAVDFVMSSSITSIAMLVAWGSSSQGSVVSFDELWVKEMANDYVARADISDLKSAFNRSIIIPGTDKVGVADFTNNSMWVTTTKDTTNETITVTNGGGANYACTQTEDTFIAANLIIGRTYRVHAKATKVSGNSNPHLSIRGINGQATGDAAVIDLNSGEGFIDFVADEYMKRVTFYVAYGSSTNGSVTTFSEIWLKEYNPTGIDYESREEIDVIKGWGVRQFNAFNKNATDNVDGKYINTSNGNLNSNSDYTTSGFIDITGITSITTSYVHIQGYYNSSKEFLSGVTNASYAAQDYTRDVPSTAKYIRVSFKTDDIAKVQVGTDVSRNDYVGYDQRMMFDKLMITDEQIIETGGIIVAPSGGDYTSFTEAIYDNLNKRCEITVKPGTYNIVAEYVALFGQDVVDDLADATDLSGFQYGIRINDKKIIFEAGSHLVCDWTGHTVNSTHRFSALSIGYNCELIGMDLDCTATFYVIHDDYGSVSQPIYKIFRNCRMIGHSIYNDNVIGGGCRPYARYVIENCYFDNNGSATSVCVRYHNSNVSCSEPVMWISNSYFEQRLSFRWYGSQTTKMKVYVNNCHANAIYKGAEGSSTNDNIELYKWCNTETNPVS